MTDELRYRVVGIRRDGTRDVRSQNLFRATAEAVEIALLASRQYRRVVIEVQRNRKAESDVRPSASTALDGGNGCVGSSQMNQWPPGPVEAETTVFGSDCR